MIELQNVSRTFGTFKAVQDVSFSIQTGEIVGFLGPNGAGKTTTMRMIANYINPSSGTILIDGKDITENQREAKKKIGYMPESSPLYGEMIVADYLSYIADIQGVNKAEKVPYLAQICGLQDVMYKNIADLSRGYKQRVGLAHALMHDPEILILDEPTSGLDPNQIAEVRSLIKEIGKTRTVIISTHILGEVEMLCDRVIIIAQGKVVADSPTEALKAKYAQSGIIQLSLANANLSELKNILSSIEGINDISEEENTENPQLKNFSISISGTKDLRPEIYQTLRKTSWTLYEFTMKKDSLEDIFKTLTTGEITHEEENY